MIKYKFKYYVYKFLNRRHSTLEKRVACALTFFVLYRLGLPDSFKVNIKVEICSGNFKNVVRRIAWLMQFSFFKRPLIKDDYFDFSIGLECDTAQDMYEYIVSKQDYFQEEFFYQLVLAQLSSAAMESQISPGDSIAIDDLERPEFDKLYLRHVSKAESLIPEKIEVESNSKHENSKPQSKEKLKSRSVNLMERHGLQVLRDVLALRHKLGIDIFVISGTFLGLHREGGFLAHDYDIDLGVFEVDYHAGLVEELNQLDGFVNVSLDYPCFRAVEVDSTVYKKSKTPSLIKLHHNSGVQVDIFIHFEDGPVYWHGSSLHRWNNLKFGLVEREFFDLKVLAPFEADRYLTENYGDWRTPVKDFNCSTGTPNVVISNSCKTYCYFLKRQYFLNSFDF